MISKIRKQMARRKNNRKRKSKKRRKPIGPRRANKILAPNNPKNKPNKKNYDRLCIK